MGLISYFKDLYYNNKLNKAESLLKENRSSEAEQILGSILDKHPLAVSTLATHYYSVSTKSKASAMADLFKKAVGLKGKGGTIYDSSAYEGVMYNFSKAVFDAGKQCFDKSAFVDSNTLLFALNESEYKTQDSISLGCEARVHILLQEIESSKSTDSVFSLKVEDLKHEWSTAKSNAGAKCACLDFCTRIESKKRFFTSNSILSFVISKKDNFKILDNAVKIVNGEDIEASVAQIKQTVSIYGKSIVLRDGISTYESLAIFNACWKRSEDSGFVLDILKSCTSDDLRKSFISNIIANHKSFFSASTLFTDFCKWLCTTSDKKEVINVLEELHNHGYVVEGYYVSMVHAYIETLSCDEKVAILNHAQSLFPDSSTIILDLYVCAKWYLNHSENEKAITVSDSIVKKHKIAAVVKCLAICNLANKETDLDGKVNLLKKASDALGKEKGSDFDGTREVVARELVQVANAYYSNNVHDKCYDILHSLAKQGFYDSLCSIVDHRLNEVRTAKTAEEKVQNAYSAIDAIRGFKLNAVLKNPKFIELWKEYVSAFIAIRKSYSNQSASEDMISLRAEISRSGLDTQDVSDIDTPVVKELIRRKYLIARELESSASLQDAETTYHEISVLENSKSPTLAALRFIICKLKEANNSEIIQRKDRIYSLLNNAASAFKAEKEDIAYRFALTLLKEGEDKEALNVLASYLPGEEYLKKACLQGDMIKAQAKLDDFNAKLKAVENKSLSSEDALFFINHMLEYSEVIAPILSIPRTTLAGYRNKLKNYAIFKFFDEEKFDVAFEKMIKEHTDYLDDLTALRNIALICLNMAEAKQIKHSNYQEVIAVWLTAIYQERLFIKSLDYTSWDDQYTFSLYDAYGHFNESTVEDLPDNVNFDDPNDENVVAIKDVQRALLDRFEAAISDDQMYHDFFTAQKDAMDAFIALNLDEKCKLVAPFLAQKDENIFNDITDALEQDREQEYDNWEDVLAVGAIYQMEHSVYHDFSQAKQYYNECIAAIGNRSVASCRSGFTPAKIVLISQFDKLSSALKSYANSQISRLSAKDKAEFKTNFNLYIIVCNALHDATLSFMFSNYTMSFVVGEVNDKNMRLYEAADYILSVYLLDSSNTRVKENLTTLFEMLVREKDANSEQAVSTILTKVKTVDASLHRKFVAESEQAKVSAELNQIVEKVNSNSLSKANALDKVYALYEKYPNNSGLCGNLATLCDMCIMEYVIGNKWERNGVERTLNKLKVNMSPEFRKHSSVFKKSYNTIWGQLSLDNRMLISGLNFDPNKSLNEKGYALKKGLEYYCALGGFSAQNPLSIGGRYNDIDLPF